MITKAILALENGAYFLGDSFGAEISCEGEVCFNTSMTGYQEILTDPSYSGQIVTMTYPEIGNYGVNLDDVESNGIKAAGFVVKNCCEYPSNWRKGGSEKGCSHSNTVTLSAYLKQNNIPGIKNIDTRKLVKLLRDNGAMGGILATGDYRLSDIIEKAKNVIPMAGQDLARKVTTSRNYDWNEPEHSIKFSQSADSEQSPFIVAMDFGIKYNILRILTSLGARVKVVSALSTAEEIMELKPDGVILSNGPGDPEPVKYAVNTIKNLIGKVPIFGICLGHQLLSLALGGKTYKLKFGHRGANHPIKNLKTGEVAITSQNHGFAVDAESLNSDLVEITHMNLNDNTVAGIQHKSLPVFSVQYHPEASPGPKDSEYLFHQFITYATACKNSKKS